MFSAYHGKSVGYMSTRGPFWTLDSIISIHWKPDPDADSSEMLYCGYAWAVPDSLNCLPVTDVSFESKPNYHQDKTIYVGVKARNESDERTIKQNITRWVEMSLKEE